jgi:hypothetical protein
LGHGGFIGHDVVDRQKHHFWLMLTAPIVLVFVLLNGKTAAAAHYLTVGKKAAFTAL